MKNVRYLIVAAALTNFGIASAAYAENFDIPAGKLGDVVAKIGSQANATIAVTDPTLAIQHSLGVHGNFSIQKALIQAFQGTEAEAVFFNRKTIRIVRKKIVPVQIKIPQYSANEPLNEIIVNASKQNIIIDSYPGSIKIMKIESGWDSRNGAEGTAAITKLIPSINSTNLGPGRNKLFIRGIADSSFNGPTQATTGQYFGDVRLTYNAPDPDLNLYDMKRIEVLVGPQGTLYGAGSLGGVLQLIPNTPNTHKISITTSGNIGFTQDGGISRNGSGMLNLPILKNKIAARFVVFSKHSAGYIDAPLQNRSDINRNISSGERFSLRAENLSGWTIDIGFIRQNIVSNDGQYTIRGEPSLTRSTIIPQPFSNNYRLGYLTAKRSMGKMDLVSTTSASRHALVTVFDATGFDGTITPTRFEENNNILLLTHETRISGGSQKNAWVAGICALLTSSHLNRSLTPNIGQIQTTEVINKRTETAIFGQKSYPFTSELTGTIGGRLTFAYGKGFLSESTENSGEELSRKNINFSGTLALDWHPNNWLSVFFHYQQGYRAGGLSIAPSQIGLLSQRYASDSLNMNELGLRLGDVAHDAISVRAAIFIADWRNIQADLIDHSGLFYTANIGNGLIYGLDGEIAWRPFSSFTFKASTFLNNSRLNKPRPEFATPNKQRLPNVSGEGSRISFEWKKKISSNVILNAETAVRYVGKSWLGVGSDIHLPQGNYLVADMGAHLDFKHFSFSIDIDNISDTRGNSFAFGNPFNIAKGNQITPLRPRTFRMGMSLKF